MKTKNGLGLLIIFLLVGIGAVKASPQQQLPEYTTADAIKHIGDEAIVKGKVFEVKLYIPQGQNKKKIIFFDIDGKYPTQAFTLVIFEENFARFPNTGALRSAYEGKPIRVRGKITDYKGKPQIILTDPGQISVVQEKNKS